MKWNKDSHLTDEQIEYLKCAGGSVKLTSYVSGITYSFILIKSQKGLIVNHLDGNNRVYLGYLPFNGHGMARDSIVHTQASKYPEDSAVFQAFRWAWKNKSSDNFRSKCLLTNG